MSVDNKVILELKSVEAMKDVHVKKRLTCLRLINMRYDILLHSNVNLMKDGIVHMVNNL